MKAILAKLISATFILLIISFVFATPVNASPTITVNNIETECLGTDGPIDCSPYFSCQPYGEGIQCHLHENGSQMFGYFKVTFDDSRGTGSNMYYHNFNSNVTGTFFDNLEWWWGPTDPYGGGSEAGYFFTHYYAGNFEGNGVENLNYNWSSSRRSFIFRMFTSIYASADIVYTLYPSPIPQIKNINTKVYLDNNEFNNHYNDFMSYLPGYFEEANKILAQSGSLTRLVWDNQLRNSLGEPWSYQCSAPTFPTSGFEYWLWFDSTYTPGSHTHGTDCNGNATGIIGTYDGGGTIPNRLNIVDSNSPGYGFYWLTVLGLVHEYGHNMGLAPVEWYSYAHVNDPTGTTGLPSASIDIDNPNDSWWNGEVYGSYLGDNGKHGLNWRNDPMSAGGWHLDSPYANESASNVFSAKSVSFIDSAAYRSNQYPLNTFENPPAIDDITRNITTVSVKQWDDRTKSAPAGAGIIVKAYYWNPDNGNATLIGSYLTNSSGIVNISWTQHYPNDRSMILIKSYFSNGSAYGTPEIIDRYNLEAYAKVYPTATVYPAELSTNLYKSTFSAVTGQSGWIQETSQGSGQGGSISTNYDLYVGDANTKTGYRSVVAFNTSSLPDNATVMSGNVSIWPWKHSGSLSNFVPLQIGIGNPCIGTCGIQSTDYQTSAYSTLGNIGIGEGVYNSIPMGTQIGLVSLTGSTEFKLWFTQPTDSDNKADIEYIYNATGIHPPTFNVYYSLP